MEELKALAKELTEKVSALALAVEQLDRRSARSDRIMAGVVLGLLINLVLVVGFAILVAGLFEANARIEAAVARESQTRQDALCPLYSLIIGSYNPNSRPEGEARQRYEQAFVTLRAAYESLDCTDPLVPPRAGG